MTLYIVIALIVGIAIGVASVIWWALKTWMNP
jgi:uncharacterized protein YneF (UPF0154 family)